MMRTWTLGLLAVVAVAAPLRAQDTPPADGMPLRAALRDRIEQNFLARAREEMNLTDEQAAKLVTATEHSATKRQALEETHRRLNQTLANQLRPGVAADTRVVRVTLDSLVALRIQAASIYKDEQQELSGFLSDLQRAQYHVLRERLAMRIEDIRQQRAMPMRRRP